MSTGLSRSHRGSAQQVLFYNRMEWIAIDCILTLPSESLSAGLLQKWTLSASVASAAERKRDGPQPADLLGILSHFGWVVQMSSTADVDINGASIRSRFMSNKDLDGFLTFIVSSDIPSAAGQFLDSWWRNAYLQRDIWASASQHSRRAAVPLLWTCAG